MFRWINKLCVESVDKNFIVTCTGRFSYEYTEQSKNIIIRTVDHGKRNGQFFDVVKSDNFERWEDGTSIAPDKQEEIKRNFVAAMAFQNIGIDIDDTPTEHYTIDDLP